MKTEVVSSTSPHAIRRALEILQSGGLVAFPTDTVYGVGALAFDQRAIESIYAAKDRPVEKAIPVLIGDKDGPVGAAFANALGISVHTLRNWEQGRRAPEGAARVLLQVAAKHPEVLWDVVKRKSTRS